MDPFNVAVAVLGALVLGLGLVSGRLARSAAPPTLLALVAGVALGPVGVGLIDPLGADHYLWVERATRLVLAVGLVSVALRIPAAYVRRHWRTAAVLVGLGMPLMWAASTVVVHLALGLDWTLAALIGAIVTPTDPVAATPIVTGSVAEEHLPDRLRHTVSLESGANDGLGYLLVLLPLLLLTEPAGEAMSHWLTHTLLWEVGAATALGLGVGWAGGRALHAAEARDLIEDDWRLVYTVALSLLAVGVGRLVHSDELLVAFAAGAAFVQVVGEEDRAGEERGQEAVNRFFAVPFFALLGTALPWGQWAAFGWRGVAMAAGVLLLRRPPVVLLLRPLLPDVRDWRETLFVGWFGPIAVAAVYYAALVTHRLGETVVWDAVTLVVAVSVVVHGVTAVPVTTRVPTEEAGS